MQLLISIVLSAAAFAACGSIAPHSTLEDARNTVQALALAFSACDLEKTASLYAETAAFQAPDTPTPILGRTAVAKHLSGACTATYRPIMNIIEQRTYPLGADGAVASGTYSIGRTDRPNDAPWTGSFVITLVNSAGGWLIQSQATFSGPQ